MDWRFEPFILPLLIATLLLLAIPRAWPQSQELIDACSADALGLCPGAVAKALLPGGSRDGIKACMQDHWAEISAGCKQAAAAERRRHRRLRK
jgi:hypothetical protein